ncbi:LamB/YcsF family protein [Streptomyces sp. N2A]|uniref:LamB/YcsF family protein n=1 Tax=Streptomyces sp. N2A TaxID=3073936 RepID=UPI0037DA79CC
MWLSGGRPRHHHVAHLALAARHWVTVDAHVRYHDLRGFGRRYIAVPKATPANDVRQVPGSGHEVRQALRPLRGDCAGRSRQRVAVASTVATALRRRRIRCPRGPAWRRRRAPYPAHL